MMVFLLFMLAPYRASTVIIYMRHVFAAGKISQANIALTNVFWGNQRWLSMVLQNLAEAQSSIFRA
jgi:hypothetical protein